MSRVDNLNSSEFKDIFRRLRDLETASPMNNAAVGRSGFEVYDGGTINVSSGTLLVNGLASITGTFRVAGGSTFTGQVTVSGPLTISGATSVTGPFTVTGDTKLNGKTDIGGNTSVTGDLAVKGPLDVTGTMDIKGKSTLQNDLTVQGGGKVKVGRMRIDPSVGNGSIVFDNGGQVFTDGATVQIYKGTSAVQVEDGAAKLMGNGGSYVTADGTGVRVAGGLRVVSPQTAPSGTAANVYMDASGNIRRIV